MSKKLKIALGILVALVLLGGFTLFEKPQPKLTTGAVNSSGFSASGSYNQETLLNATTTTATSTAIDITGAKKVSWMFYRNAHSTGNTVFTIKVTNDLNATSTNAKLWTTYNKLITNVTNSNSQTLTRVGSITTSDFGTTTAVMDLDFDSYRGALCTVAITTDGNSTCEVIVER